uniref:Uncharacterized protein n=1 Tax=Timema monikensis TaxID=170555 RepID=A0A7R9E1F9_9NEOP|nr:unnamed protein product [Timema monikensis]
MRPLRQVATKYVHQRQEALHNVRDFTPESAKRSAEVGIPIITTWGGALSELVPRLLSSHHTSLIVLAALLVVVIGGNLRTSPQDADPGAGYASSSNYNSQPLNYDTPEIKSPSLPRPLNAPKPTPEGEAAVSD